MKYHSKRNHISNFVKNYPDWSYENINVQNISECIDLHTNWIENKDNADSDSDYSLEFEAVLSGFENYSDIGFKGGLIRVNNKPIAYTFGEKLNDHCFVTHFEKAPSDIQGAYAIINREFAKRLEEDSYAKLKYDSTAEQDEIIIRRVSELAEKRGVTMTEISLAWLLSKGAVPVAGETKIHHAEGAAKAADIKLNKAEIKYLEEPYVPHKLVGVMAQNTPEAAKEKHVWGVGNQKVQEK